MGYVPPSMASVPEWQRIVASEFNNQPWRKRNVLATKTSAYTIVEGDDVVPCDATGAAFSVTLPAAAQFTGMNFTVIKIDAAANNVTLDGNGSETINGAATYAITAQWESATVISNGTGWFVIA